MSLDRAEIVDAGESSQEQADVTLDRAADIALARACAAGDNRAIRTFETKFFAEVRACHARIRRHGLALDELEQLVREKLFVKGAIAQFLGKSGLHRWLRVLTTRLIVDHVRCRRSEVPLEDQLLRGLADSDVEAALAKAQLRCEIRVALRQAFTVLTDRQKLLLQSEVRGVALSTIAAMYHVHVRSIQRWTREAHGVFLTQLRRALADRLRMTPGGLSSMVRFARSQLVSGLGDLIRESASPEARSA